ELKLLDAEVNQLFSPLKRALKKFRRITLQNEYESLIDNYLESPLVGLIDDRDFNILKLFEDIQRKISSLNLDEKENTKIKTQMDNITKEVLEVTSKKYDELKQQLLFIKDEINNNTVLSDLERLGKELNILNDEIKRGETELQELTTKRDSFDVDNKIQVLQTLVNNSLGTNICIKS
ncbi:hypothetical protein KY312_03260, partial [Candidatus Woesearchaeota archaeon]|nr:hypothetical protein [Candidatus Woesearchaeota archaeon]